jgi:hypothetical protein
MSIMKKAIDYLLGLLFNPEGGGENFSELPAGRSLLRTYFKLVACLSCYLALYMEAK